MTFQTGQQYVVLYQTILSICNSPLCRTNKRLLPRVVRLFIVLCHYKFLSLRS